MIAHLELKLISNKLELKKIAVTAVDRVGNESANYSVDCPIVRAGEHIGT
jgi:hypothetical protein